MLCGSPRSKPPRRSSSARGSGWYEETNSRMRSVIRARTCGTFSTECVVTSERHTHRRRSSIGNDQSAAKRSRLLGTTRSRCDAARGIGRSYARRRAARGPTTTLPAVTPSIIGVSIFMSPPKKSVEGSSMGSSAADSAAARSSNSGRYASIVWCAHNARATGSASRGRPVLDGVSPVAWLTCSSATRTSCSRSMRANGSTFGSDSPSLATAIANWRAASQLKVP